MENYGDFHYFGDPKKKKSLEQRTQAARSAHSNRNYGNYDGSLNNSLPSIQDIVSLPDYEVAGEQTHKSALVNGLTKWMNEINKMGIKNKEWEVQEQSFEELSLEAIKEWKQLNSMKKQQLEYIASLDPNRDPDMIHQASENLRKIDDRMRELDQYFQTEGRGTDTVLNLMYDKSRLNDSDALLMATNNVISAAKRWADVADLNRIGEDYLWTAKSMTLGAWPMVESIIKGDISPLVDFVSHPKPLEHAVDYLGKGHSTWISAVRNLINYTGDKDALIKENLRGDDYASNQLAQKLYRGNRYSKSTDSAVYDPSYISLDITDKMIGDTAKDIEDKKRELITELELKMEEAKLGKINIGIGDFEIPTPFTYDTRVDADWEKEDQEYDGSLIDIFTRPTHALASTASTVSFLRYQLPMMGAEAATQWLFKKYGTQLILGALPLGRAQAALTWLGRGITAGAAAGEIYTAATSREYETAVEALDAYQERVVNDASHNGADLLRVGKAITEGLQKQIGEAANDIPFDEKLKLGITMGIKTGDPVWDKQLVSARSGLMKLINENNTLAIADYIESIPYMPISGAAVSKALKREVFNNQLIKRRAALGKSTDVSKIGGDAAERLWQSNKVLDEISKSLLEPGGFILTKIDKIAKKVINKDLQKGLWTRDILSYAATRLPMGFTSSIKEGIEEGQQHLLQQRYGRGEYDGYDKPQSMLDFDSAIADLDLASDAIADYMGLNYADLENGDRNLRKAMNIGATSSFLFGNARHVFSNIPGWHGATPNMTDLILNIRASNTVKELMANDYQRALDYLHADLFLKAIERGKNAGQIKNHLQFLMDQQYQVGESAVTLDMVDADKLLVDAVYSIYHDKDLRNLAKEHGIKPSDEKFRFMMIDGATRMADVWKTSELINKQNKEQLREMDETSNTLHFLLESFDSERGLEIVNSDQKIKMLYDNFQRMYDQAAKEREDAIHVNKLAIERDVKKALTIPKEKPVKAKKGENLAEIKKANAIAAANKVDSRKEDLYDQYNISEAKRKELDGITKEQDFIDAFVDEAIRQTQIDIAKQRLTDAQKAAEAKISRYQGEDDEHLEQRKAAARREAIFNDTTLRARIREQIKKEGQLPTEGLIRKETNRRMRQLANDELEGTTVDNLISLHVDQLFLPMSKESFFDNKLFLYYKHKADVALLKAIDLSKNQIELLKFVRKMTGLDIDTRNLKGLIDTLEKQQEIAKERQKKFYASDEKNPFINGEYSWDVENDDDAYERTGMSIAINTAMLGHLNTIASAYKFGSVNPNLIQDAIYGLNHDGDTEFGEFIKIQKEAEAIKKSLGDTEGKEGQYAEAELKSRNAAKDAAWKLIETRMNESAKRSRIARREFIEDAIEDAGVEMTKKDVDDVENAMDEASGEAQPTSEKHEYSESQKKIIKDQTGRDIDKEEEQRQKLKEAIEKKKLEQKEGQSELKDDEKNYLPAEEDEEESAEEQEEVAEDPLDNGPEVLTNPLENVSVDDQDEDEAVDTAIANEEAAQNEMTIALDNLDTDIEQFYVDQDAKTAGASELLTELLERVLNGVKDWVEIEDFKNLFIDGHDNLCYRNPDGTISILPKDQAEYIFTEFKLLLDSEYSGLSLNLIPIGENATDEEYRENVTDEFIGNLLANTAFYAIDEAQIDKPLADEGHPDTINGVKLSKEIGTPRKLSENLLKPGWLASTKKYYIVTKSNKIKELDSSDGWRNAMVVALVLEDENECYLTFLRGLGKGKDKSGNPVDDQLHWYNWMQTKNANIAKIELVLGHSLPADETKRANAIATFIKNQVKLTTRLLWQGYTGRQTEESKENADLFEAWWDGKTTSNQVGLSATRKAVVEQARNFVLRSFSMDQNPKRQLLDQDTVNKQLEKLATLRNEIINAYLDIDEKQTKLVEVHAVAKTTVEPNEVMLSNGRIDNMRKHKLPVFRKLDNSGDIDKITDAIESGRVLFGVGRGVRSKEKYRITGLLNKDADLRFDGKGLSGKIYLFKKGVTGKLVPIMLSERKLNEQTVIEKDGKEFRSLNIQQTLLYKDGKLQNNSAADTEGNIPQPSIAEVLFYMITHKFDFGNTDFDKQTSITEFFIHHGKDTILQQLPDYSRANSQFLNILASKQLNYGLINNELKLQIALYNPSIKGYTLTEFKESDLFDESTPERSENSAKNRQMCIEAIASQMHWNTDKAHINLNINVGGSATEMSQFVRHMMEVAEQTGDIKTLDQLNGDIDAYLNQSFNIMGCPDMRFVIKDFYKKNEKASVTDDPLTARSVNTLAWMINNGILMTDVSKLIFKDPYVFTFGVKGRAERKLGPIGPSKIAPVTEDNELVKRIAVSNEDKKHIVLSSDSEEKRKQVLENLQSEAPTALELILVTDNWDETNYEEKTKELVERYENEHGIKFESVGGITPIEAGTLDSDSAIIFTVYKTDTGYRCDVQIYDTSRPLEQSVHYITGVYSLKKDSENRRGTLDTVKARKWLALKLGIANYNIYVQRAAFLSASSEEAYGFMNVAADVITDELVAKFGLSTEEGSKGVHYHEAWHYVNLLLHDAHQRQAVWDAFVKAHGDKYKGKSYKEIEEVMADDFVKWIENTYGEGRFGIIGRVYQSVVDLVDFVLRRNRNDYKKVYRAIRNGEYKFAKSDTASIQQFLKNYQGVAYSIKHKVFLTSEALTENLENVNAYQELYDGIDSIINTTMLISDVKDIRSAKAFVKDNKIDDITKDGGTIDNIIKVLMKGKASKVEDLTPYDRQSVLILQAIKKNPDILKSRIISRFRKLGFKASFKEDQNDATKKEDKPDNTWDKFDLSISKKMELSAQVKLFLSTIPKYVSSPNSDGTVKYKPEFDRFGQVKTWDFDKAWNVLARQMCEVKSYAKLDSLSEYGGFAKNSLRGTVKRLARTNPLFFALDAKLDKLEKRNRKDQNYSNIKSLLLGAFNLNMNHVYTIDVQNPHSADVIDLDSDEIFVPQQFTTTFADIDNLWGSSDDGVYNPAFVLPRTWSQTLMSKGVRAKDATGKLVISKQFKDDVHGRFVELLRDVHNIEKSLKKTGGSVEELLTKNNEMLTLALHQKKTGLVTKLINFYNYLLGIPVDSAVLYTFISTLLNAEGVDFEKNPQFVFDGIKKIINSTAVGSLKDIVDTINNSVGKQEFTATSGGRTKQKAADELYTGYHLDTHIAKLALAYSSVYPSLKELSSKSANGDTVYPINLNNFISDVTTKANLNKDEFIKNKRRAPYNRHSILLQAIDNINDRVEESRLRLNTFVGMKKVGTSQGSDYLDIIPAEDYLCKLYMAENNNLPFPTMAGKKTYYSLSVGSASKAVKEKIDDHHSLQLVHDTIIVNVGAFETWDIVFKRYQQIDPYDESKHGSMEDYKATVRKWRDNLDAETKLEILEEAEAIIRAQYPENFCRFGDSTISIFCGYFLDEINTLIEFYNEDNVKTLVALPTKLINNFHGKVDGGKLLFGGNGGKFRYFYNIDLENVDKVLGLKLTIPQLQQDGSIKQVPMQNLNQKLQALYELLKAIESGEVKDLTKGKTDVVQNVPQTFINQITQKKGETDGFELIRMYLAELKKQTVVGQDIYTPAVKQQINSLLINATKQELHNLSKADSLIKLCEKKFGQYYPKGIPELFFVPYLENLRKLGRAGYKQVHPRGSEEYGDRGAVDALFSLIGSFVANTAIAVIETEKIYTGDPAYYKWSTAKKVDESGKKVDITQPVTVKLSIGGIKARIKAEVDILTESFTDKIKRLGGTLSPGTELRRDFSSEELELEKKIIIDHLGEEALDSNFLLNSSLYSVLEVRDAECDSIYLDMIRLRFEKQAMIDLIRQGDIKIENPGQIIREIYDDEKAYDKYLKKFKNVKTSENITVELFIDREVTSLSGPYMGINVADAQVFVRPMMYRNLRKRMGEWTNEDEEAFWILETDDSWMHDEQKSRKVNKFLLNALKMSYFGYDIHNIAEGLNIDKPLYNKMAIFPLFKFHRSTDVGRMLYDRMNRNGDVLDMIAFSSAVKVGGFVNAPESIDKEAAKKDPKNALNTLSKALLKSGDKTVNYSTGVVENRKPDDTIPISVQSLENLRLQLNTKAHLDEERSIGTLLLKMAFQNILDDETYRGELGADIKQNIIDAINRITEFGAIKIRNTFYKNGEISATAVRDYLKTIIENNGLGAIAKEILDHGNTIASLMSRDVFELSVIKKINSEVIDINTKGGAAIQQSIFGFVGVEKNRISEYEEGDRYAEYNGGEELQWCNEDGATEVFLSIKFFDFMIPSEIKSQGFAVKRQWLINRDIIKGLKKSIPTFKYNDKEYDDINPEWEQTQTFSKPKPFGVGYRIPTQGMPSMFAMAVADVLPEQTGDLIVVPREFTGQTGSDFDVDKIYITTLSYDKEGYLYTKEDDTADGWKNELLRNFINLISATENFGQSRGSIDVFTKTLKRPDGVLDLVNSIDVEYMPGFKALSPYFQTNRKMEFATGKNGIGPFALALANLALAQTTHLSIDFGDDEAAYGLRPLDRMYGADGRLCSGWLSAMINAHVDVEKDPYVFSLNVNRATYSMAEFLIRTGKGDGTFAFLSQPILKEYAQMVNSSGNIWGTDLYGDGEQHTNVKTRSENYLKSKYLGRLEKVLNTLNLQNPNDEDLKQLNAIWYYFNYKKELIQKRKNKLLETEEEKNDKNAPTLNVDWKSIISLTKNVDILRKLADGSDKARAIVYAHLLLALLAFKNLEKYADALSELVQVSQIDTKKFGNTIPEQMMFVNKFLNFVNKTGVKWKITTEPYNPVATEEEKVATSIKALMKYFKETFLYDKFEKATSLTQEILKGLAVSASDQFLTSFIRMMQEEVGSAVFEHVSFPVYFGKDGGFSAIYKKNKAIAMSNALQNVLRYRMFQNQAHITFGQLQNDEISEFARLASGEHEMHPSQYMRYLYFGVNENGAETQEGSIFLRLSDLVELMKSEPRALTEAGDYAFERLVDANGNILNDLLLYLQPMLPTENYPLGRIMLADSQMNVSDEIKSRYVTAFYQLLLHPNPVIRKLAEDLVIFAYYSQYDQNAPGAFFDLVPYEYRQIYDKSLATDLLTNVEMTTEQTSDLEDIVARNYWFSDDVVKRHAFKDGVYYDPFTFETKGGNLQDNKYFETGLEFQYDVLARASFPGAVLTTNTGSKYIKLSKNGLTYLYRKAGVIVRTVEEKESGSKVSVYIAIPKAGMYTKGVKQFEFYADYETDSIFDQNRLPVNFAEDILRQKVVNWVSDKNKLLNKKYTLELQWGVDQIPETRRSTNFGAYKEVVKTDNSANENASGTIISWYKSKQKPKYGSPKEKAVDIEAQKNADVILNIVFQKTASDTRSPNINESKQQSVFDLVIGQPIDADEFYKFFDQLKIGDEKLVIIHVTTPIADDLFYKLDSDRIPETYKKEISETVNDMILQQLAEYKTELDADEELKDLERVALYLKKESELQDLKNIRKLQRVAVRQYVYEWFNNVASSINRLGIPISKYTSFITAYGNGEITTGCISYNYANDQFNVAERPTAYADELYKYYNVGTEDLKHQQRAAKYNKYRMFMDQLKNIYSLSRDAEIDDTPVETTTEEEREKAFNEEPNKEIEKELKKSTTFKWAIKSDNNYELSSRGDLRFSAFNAKLSDGRTIEEAYQLDVKGYRQLGYTIMQAKNDKGTHAPILMTNDELYEAYLGLWQQWASENPELIEELRKKAEGKVLTDMFTPRSNVSQARALADILNGVMTEKQITEPVSVLKKEEGTPKTGIGAAVSDDNPMLIC